MAAGNFTCFCFFSSQIAYRFGLHILLKIATKGDIQYLVHFFRLLKKVDALPSMEKKKA